MGLRRTLERIQNERRAKGLTIHDRRKPITGKVGVSEFTDDGIEKPTVLGLRWLSLFGEALRLHRKVWSWRVSAEDFEVDGCVSLYLQAIVFAEVQAPVIRAGAAMVTPGTQYIPVAGGTWTRHRIPTGLVNNHDTKGALRKVLEPKDVDVVLADSIHLRAMHGH